MKNLLLLITILPVFILPVSAQKTPDFQTIKTEKGMMLLYRNEPQAFSFLVPQGNQDSVQNDDGSLLIATDSDALSEALLVFFIKKSDFLDKKKMYDDSEILSVHRDLTVKKLEQVFKTKVNLDIDSKGFVKVYNLTNNLFPTKLLPTSYWSYVAPTPKNTDRTLFQTVVIGDLVLVLGTAFNETTGLEKVRDFFKQTLESITLLPLQKQTVTPKKKPLKSKIKKR